MLTFKPQFKQLLFSLCVLVSLNAFSQTTIWQENFTYPDNTIAGTGNRWTRTVTSGIGYFEVRSNQFHAKDTDAKEQIFSTEVINILSYSNVSLSADAFKVGGTMEGGDFVKFFYKLNGGLETQFSTNGINLAEFGSVTSSQSGLNGTTIQIIIRVQNGTGNSEIYGFDNILVQGTSSCPNTGTILLERYDGILGTSIADLIAAPNYPNNPTATLFPTSFEALTNIADDYGVRMRGTICIPQTGTYYFWVAGDDNVLLYLSTDNTEVNKTQIAYHNSWTNSREWNKFTTQKSVGIILTAGQSYYVEALMKEGGGGDNLAVGWRKPSDGNGASPVEVIPGSFLAPPQTPEINVQGLGNTILSGDTSPSTTDGTDLGDVNVFSGNSVNTFTIQNLGTSNLSLTGASPFVTISGANASDFSITTIPSNVISSGSSTTFQVTFDPSAIGVRSANISIANNDNTGGENPYTFSIQGTGTVPTYCSSNGSSTNDEWIGRVQLNTINNSSGTGTTSTGYSDFTPILTNLVQGTSYSITITPTWRNTRYDEGYSVWIDYNADGDFTDSGEQVLIISPTNATSVNGSFTVPTSTAIGSLRMRVSMKYNGIPTSCENFSYGEVEDYTVNIISSTPMPEINITGNGINIADGDATPDVVDHTFFGSVDVALGSVARTFTIENLGTLNLTLDGASPYVVLSGHTSDFTLTANPSTPIAPSGSTTFTVTFNPTTTGTRTVTVSIANNDDDEHPYTFVLEGIGFDFGSICGVTINTYPYAEDFETGIGSWSQDAGDNFDWTRDLGGTPTNNTGPDIAASGSYYMYTEATGNTNNTANFISPCFDLTSTTNPRITFFYHMHGSTYTTNAQGDRSYTNYMGTLNVDLSTDGGVTFPTNLFSHTGYVQVDELSSWIPLSFDLSLYIGQTIKIRIQGIISSDGNNRSDMAIDYFVLMDKPEPLYAPGGITADLALWLKANDGHNYANGQSVSLWQDQGRGADARTHVTGQEPTYRDNVSQNVNFNPVIEFDNPYNSFTTDLDYRHNLTTNSQFLIGDYGMYTQEMFIVLIPDDTPINSSFGFMDVLTADSNLTKSETDATGIGFGDYTGRINNEVIAYAHSTYNKNESGDGFAVYQQGSESYTNIGIINTRNNTLNNNQELYYNANDIREFTNDQAEYLNTSDTRYFIGRSEGWQASLNARVAEVITYSSRKNDTDLTQERNRIQSYLAIKYGITLGTNGTSQDYVASDGTLIWDVNTSTPTEDVFNYNITGIGRDDVAELNQKQSKSVNTTNDITIGHGDILATNNLNTNNFTADKSYLVWGNNNGSLTAQTPVVVNLSAGISGLTTNVEFTSIGRTWKVVKKGTVGMAKIAIPQTMLTATITPPGSFLMFISDEPTFSPTSEYRIMNLNGSNLETYYEFTSSEKFITFGYAPEKTFTRSIYFDGTKDYLNVGNKLDLNTTFTISAWIKRSNTNASIVSKRNNTYANGGYDFKINASGNLEMSWKNGATQTITSSVVIPSNKWHHVAVVYNGTQAKLYIDGVEDVTQTKNLAVPIANTESFLIAAADGNESNTTSFFQGNIDEVRIWNTALSQDQLRYVMNQEIENDGTKVSGSYFKNLTITPSKNDINAVDWASLKGYYPMSVYTFTNCKDASGNGNVAAIKKLNTVDWQTAPLPYVSIADTDWDVSSTWQNGSVQTIPGTASIVDATKTVDWNIVQISSNVTLENSSLPAANFGNRNVLGLLVDNTKKLEITGANPTTTDPYSGTGNGITISHYLGLNGKIDLQGESQLIQTLNSDLNVGTNGVLERDQQGVGNKYWYNDWSSPVYSLNDGLNYSRIIDVLRDGTNPSSPGAITYVGGYDGAVGPPITLSTYWMYKYANHPEGSYSLWEQIGNTGKIYPGQGFLMKGTGAAADQNYVFVGKPNNGNFDLNITSKYDYLLGNPYASAIDSWEFIDDNPNITGPLYFWEHYGGTNHNLKDYQAGYATLTKAGGVTATSGGVIPAGVSNIGTSTKTPGRFIPVGQGFFVVGSTDGQIHFKNSQRIFFKEAEETVSNFGSVFMKGITKKTTKSASRFIDNRQKIRIGFEGAKVDHRQLLLTIDENASDGVDRGYEAEIYEVFEDDMYWVIQDKKYVIQATNAIENNKEILLGVKVKETSTVKIKIDELENEDVNMQLFLKDSLLQKTYNLKESPFEQEIEAGEYVNRFYLVFKPIPKVIEEGTEIIEEISGVHIFMNNQIAELQIQKDAEINISEIKLVNYLGQNIKVWNQKFDGTLISLPIKLATGVYVVQMKTEKGIINEKIIIE